MPISKDGDLYLACGAIVLFWFFKTGAILFCLYLLWRLVEAWT